MYLLLFVVQLRAGNGARVVINSCTQANKELKTARVALSRAHAPVLIPCAFVYRLSTMLFNF